MEAALRRTDEEPNDSHDAHPQCRCGTDRSSRAATPEREYTLAGAAYLLWGGTSVPKRVRFRCVYCGDVFDECTDRASLRAFII